MHNRGFTIELVWQLVQVVVVRTMFCQESDSNALNLYDSDGNNSEPFVESRPRPYQYEPRRIPRNDPHEDSIEPVDSEDDRLGNTDWYLIHCVIYLYLA